MFNSLVRRSQPNPFGGLVDQFFRNDPGFAARAGEWPETQARFESWNPAVDVHEEDEAFVLTVDLPGMGKDEVDINVEDRTLSISGERKFEEKTEQDAYRRLERGYGRFSRSFSLPSHVDSTRVAAKFHNGVLTVTVPKSEAARSRRIDIS